MDAVDNSPIPRGMIWNMTYNRDLLERSVKSGDFQPVLSEEQLWDNHRYFLEALLPVAQAAGVMLAAHPDDPPVERVRGQPRLVWRPELYDRLIDSVPSPMNRLELCLGTLAEMPDHKLEETLRHYLDRDAVGYIHFRNVRGHAPHYKETFIDEGDIDMPGILEILHERKWDGVLIPDHTPQMSCLAPWHSGMAFAMGYIKSLMDQLNKRISDA
jgi:mannonate dehydratase